MIELESLTLRAALEVVHNMRESDRYAMRAMLGKVSEEAFAMSRWQTEGPAWTMVKDGAPVAIFGLSLQCPWLAVAWLVATPAMNGETWRFLLRHCRIVASNVGASEIRRVEAYVFETWPEAKRFAERVGLTHEGTRRKAGRHGEDIHTYALTRG